MNSNSRRHPHLRWSLVPMLRRRRSTPPSAPSSLPYHPRTITLHGRTRQCQTDTAPSPRTRSSSICEQGTGTSETPHVRVRPRPISQQMLGWPRPKAILDNSDVYDALAFARPPHGVDHRPFLDSLFKILSSRRFRTFKASLLGSAAGWRPPRTSAPPIRPCVSNILRLWVVRRQDSALRVGHQGHARSVRAQDSERCRSVLSRRL
ncbi:hypothetical protein C8Q76DRAFT_178465 [Earliella scabrosa]|nr:hypothetical protein C8Q76DRAFT_178465 [Earliella scabrosa]